MLDQRQQALVQQLQQPVDYNVPVQPGQYMGQPMQTGSGPGIGQHGRMSPNVIDATGVQDPRQTVVSPDMAQVHVRGLQQRRSDSAMDPSLLEFRRGTEYDQGLRALSGMTQNPK